MKKKKIRLKYKKERVLLSDILPYELPFIFTNRYFYRFIVKNGIQLDGDTIVWKKGIEEGAELIISAIVRCKKIHFDGNSVKAGRGTYNTIPFTYGVSHKPTKCRYLSIIHPVNQIKIVDFYERYKHVLLYLCSKSRFSLRYPEKVACFFYYKDRLHSTLLGKRSDKMEMYFSEYENLRTYFSYKNYTNIYKFYEDYRYQRAEKKFQHLVKFDLQSCFDSIYTHSISWAMCGGSHMYKELFAGIPDNAFGEYWDNLMQEMNYNETHGIVIGPEFSRIFAEVILQEIDKRVENKLLECGYSLNRDYECYRYVDDYFFFYNSEEVKNKALELFEEYLKEYKLTISSDKTVYYERPFITPISKAKIAIDELLKEYIQLYKNEKSITELIESDEIDLDKNDEESETIKIKEETIVNAINCELYFKFSATEFCKRFKRILSTNEVTPKDVMNYSISRLSVLIERILKRWDRTYKPLCYAVSSTGYNQYKIIAIKQIRKMEKALAKFLFEIIDSLFFLYSTNKRVNTTLKAMQLLNTIIVYLDHDYSIKKSKLIIKIPRFSEYIREIVFKKIRDEVSLVIKSAPINEKVQLETLYFLILLKQLNPKYHINAQELESHLVVKTVNGNTLPQLNAIAVITLLYYMGLKKEFVQLQQQIVDQVINRYQSMSPERIKISAEQVILALDLAACPFILRSKRVTILQKIGLSRPEGEKVVAYLQKHKYMYTKWTGINVTKELNAKISQEVYS